MQKQKTMRYQTSDYLDFDTATAIARPRTADRLGERGKRYHMMSRERIVGSYKEAA